MQSGGSTPVINRSLFGVVQAAIEDGGLGEIYGASHGLEGLLVGRLIDLRDQGEARWSRIARTPGAALGSTRRKLTTDDVPAVLRLLDEKRIGYLFIIGGNDSAETGHTLYSEAAAAGMPLTVIHVPKTIDNDLALTDHSPGYGSAARFVALATMGAGRDAEGMGASSPITVIEVMGRDAGWLAASAALGKRDETDAPHVICLPEVPVNEDRFLGLVEEAYGRYGSAVAVVAENARGAAGPLGGDEEPWYVDDFGHPYYEGAGRHLAALAGRRLSVRVRYERPGTIQRSMAACVSTTDAREAGRAGQAAVRYALEGATDAMVTLVRGDGAKYACSTGLAPLEQVAGQVKRMPDEYLDPSRYAVTQPFLDYARPLIGPPLPWFGRLR
jgi:6-phosphofructokinase